MHSTVYYHMYSMLSSMYALLFSFCRAVGVVSITVLTNKLVSGAVSCSDLASKAKVEKYKTVSPFFTYLLCVLCMDFVYVG